MQKTLLGLMAAGALALAAGHADAAAPPDEAFARKAAQGGLAEVEMGQLIQQKGTTSQVKQFGQMLVQDHTAANNELQQIAQQAGITLPDQPDKSQQAQSRRLRSLSGTEFDKAAAEYGVRDHQQDIREFRREAQSGKDPALKDWAQKNLSVLQKHLQMAQGLERSQP